MMIKFVVVFFLIGNLDTIQFPLPLEEANITSHYGKREKILFHNGGGSKQFHEGIDMVGSKDIRAVMSGTVKEHYPAPNGYYRGHPVWGGYVVIQHINGLCAHYAHLSMTFDNVREGKKIIAGDIIGEMGDTGISTGDHLHFAVSTCAQHNERYGYLPIYIRGHYESK